MASRGGGVIITSDRALPPSLNYAPNGNSAVDIPLPPLTEDEAIFLFETSGCPMDKAKAWGKITVLFLDGHPQLLHAAAQWLKTNNWQSTDIVKALGGGDGADRQREQARRMIATLPENQRTLLYRISLYSGHFRQNHAIAAGKIKAKIPHTAEAFDALTGPWIESIGSGYFRVSSLVKGCGAVAYTQDEINTLRGKLAYAMLSCGNLTTMEGSDILFQGFLGGHNEIINGVIDSIMSRPFSDQKELVPEFEWVTYVGTDSPALKNPLYNRRFRLFQIIVAMHAQPERLSDLLERFNQENPGEKNPWTVGIRFMAYMTSLSRDMSLTLRKCVTILNDLATIADKIEADPTIKDHLSKTLFVKDGTAFDLIDWSYLTICYRIRSADQLREFIDSLESTPNQRNPWKAFYAKHPFLAAIIIDGALTNVEGASSSASHWPNVLTALDRAIELADKWDIPILKSQVYAAKLKILDEEINDVNAAKEHDETAEKSLANISWIYLHARALFWSHHGRDREAVALWESLFPTWPWESCLRLKALSITNAATVYAQLGDYKKAAAFFEEATTFPKNAQTLTLLTTELGAKIDAAIAYWKLGKVTDFLRLFDEILTRLDNLPNDKTNLPLFRIRKVIDVVLLRIGNGEPLNVGIGSLISYDKEQLLQASTQDSLMNWVALATIESQEGLGYQISRTIQERVEASEILPAKTILTTLTIKQHLEGGLIDNLPSLIDKAASLYSQALQTNKAKNAGIPSPSFLQPKITDELIPFCIGILETGLQIGLFLGRKPNELLSRWNDQSESLYGKEIIQGWLLKVIAAVALSISEKIQIVCNDDDREKRFICAILLAIDLELDAKDHCIAHIIMTILPVQSSRILFTRMKVWAPHAAPALVAIWKKHSEQRALMSNPVIEQPRLKAACSSDKSESAKIASILLVAIDAFKVNIDARIIEFLRKISSEEESLYPQSEVNNRQSSNAS